MANELILQSKVFDDEGNDLGEYLYATNSTLWNTGKSELEAMGYTVEHWVPRIVTGDTYEFIVDALMGWSLGIMRPECFIV